MIHKSEGIAMSEHLSCGKQWLDTFANFRKGSLLTEIIKLEDPYIREPYWISPLYDDDYRLYHTFDLEGITRGEFPLAGDGPLWDGVCKDDVSRKYLFVRALDTPNQLKGGCPDISQTEKEQMAKVFKMLNLDGDLESWYTKYYPVARDLTWTMLTGDPMAQYLERGYRTELIYLTVIDNFYGNPTSVEEWDAFYNQMIDEMFGPRGIPYVIFTVPFQV